MQVCLPTVVEVFASITNHHEIVFCYSILEQNKRLILSSPAVNSEVKVHQQDQTNLLDCYFPFDPYYLKRYILSVSVCRSLESYSVYKLYK